MSMWRFSTQEHLVIPALSFFSADGELDLKATLAYIRLLNRSPVRRVILFGTTGEGLALSLQERCELLNLYERELDEHFDITVHTATWCLRDITILSQTVSRSQRLLQLPFVHYLRDDPNLARFIAAISVITPFELYLYHLPKNTRFSFTPDHVRAYKKAGARVTGIKLSHTEVLDIRSFARLPNFEVWYGSDTRLAEAIDAGAAAVVSQSLAANFMGLLPHDLDIAQTLIQRVRDVTGQVIRERKISNLKKILRDMTGLDFPIHVRTPNLPSGLLGK